MESEIQAAWQQALAFWGISTQLAEPISSRQRPDTQIPAIACIRLEDREIIFNENWIRWHHATDCLPAIFAHEMGHHLRFPHSLRIAAELHLLAESLIPGLPFVFQNLFWDLLVNQAVGEDLAMRQQLIRIYQLSLSKGTPVNPMFAQYLFIYEVLWGLENAFGLAIEPDRKRLLRAFTQDFYQLEDFHDQFLFFLARFVQFLDVPKPEDFNADPFSGDFPTPGVRDYPEGGEPTPAMRKALERAQARAWLPVPKDKQTSDSAYRTMQRALSSAPGSHPARLHQAADLYYRKLIERHLEVLPKFAGETQPDAFIPSVMESWNVGDDVGEIDWLESMQRMGGAAAAQLLRREYLPDDDEALPGRDRPYFEIYLDTSGSMPNPVQDTNMMTLAALILAVHCIRQGGSVRGLIYSQGPCLQSDWMQSEARARAFFLQYIGGGTEFPFKQLTAWSAERRGVYRLIISDSDFLQNIVSAKAVPILSEALERSKLLVAMLANVTTETLVPAIGNKVMQASRFSFVPVSNQKDFAGVATALARALLGENL